MCVYGSGMYLQNDTAASGGEERERKIETERQRSVLPKRRQHGEDVCAEHILVGHRWERLSMVVRMADGAATANAAVERLNQDTTKLSTSQ